MDNILIIKTGAAGDVVRTTSLLNVLKGDIYWVTSAGNKLLLPSLPNLKSFTLQEAADALKGLRFEQVISLEEDADCARLASFVDKEELAGIYLNKDTVSYTDNSAYWFDMSRVSRFGLEKANKLKADNFLSYQDCIFKMIGRKFAGEPYAIYDPGVSKVTAKLVGLEKRTGDRWPDKQWWGYNRLADKLEGKGYAVKIFGQRDHIHDYLKDIAECSHIISGDTLAMHIALAYEKTCTAIFNCTSPQEIYDYGLLKKVVSPLLKNYFYANSYDKEVIESISVEAVMRAVPV